MEMINPDTAKAVWQRVQSTSRPPELQGLLLSELRMNAEYARLLRKPGTNAAALRQMQEQSKLAISVLRGICRLTGQNCRIKLPPQQKEELPLTVLRRCYGQNLTAAGQYQTLAQNAEYGHAFSWLQQQKYQHALTLLQIIGSEEK